MDYEIIPCATGNFAIPYIQQKTKGPWVTAPFEFYGKIVLLKTNRISDPENAMSRTGSSSNHHFFKGRLQAFRFTEYDPLNTFFALEIPFFSECPNKTPTSFENVEMDSWLIDFYHIWSGKQLYKNA